MFIHITWLEINFLVTSHNALYIFIYWYISKGQNFANSCIYIYIVYQKVFVRTAKSFYKFAFFKRTANLYGAINNRSLSLDKNSTKQTIIEFVFLYAGRKFWMNVQIVYLWNSPQT